MEGTIWVAQCTYNTREVESPAALKERYFYQPHHLAISELSEGKYIWAKDEDSSNHMLEFRSFIQHRWFPLPSNMQFVEARVKDSKLCSGINRSEMMRTLYTVNRSGRFSSYLQAAAEEQGGAVLRANKHMTAGKRGERSRKLEDGSEVAEAAQRTEVRVKIQGARKGKHVIIGTMEQTAKRLRITSPEDMAKVAATRKAVLSPDSQFAQLRVDSKLSIFMNSKDNDKPLNAIQTAAGMSITPYMMGLIRYGCVKSKLFLPYLREELNHRGVDFEDGMA
jgi:hypothetical protein